MCGIIGIASQAPLLDRDWILVGRDGMTHRGPDDAGVWWSVDGRVGLAHRRLAIIDLSPAGHQPMSDDSGTVWIVFNGEIYNFTDLRAELAAKGALFRSHSDTEVILAAYREWGTDCLSRFNGMFAFAIYDAQRRSLFLARDRAGEKPLFYAWTEGVLRFASELKGLMADPTLPRCIDAESLDCYLAMGYVPGKRCILQDVNKLPPAHALLFNLTTGHARCWRYWQMPELEPSAAQGRVDEAALLDQLEGLLEGAVRRQMVADVPVGVLLSGGVDSSLVTAMAVRASRAVKTFTVRFPDFGAYDETEHARLIARHFKTEHIELDATRAGPDVLPLLARQYDEPIVDSSMIPTYLLSQLVRRDCTVALGGDGGDELFGGYLSYNRVLWMQQKFGWLPLALRREIARGARAILPIGFKGRGWLQSLGYDLNHELPLSATHFDIAARSQLLGEKAGGPAFPVAECIFAQRIPSVDDILQRATRMDFENYMAEDILVKVDRASMLNSLEIRAPLLDYRIIEFAFGRVPSHLKTTADQRKVLLKKLSARLLPSGFDTQRKRGFAIPLRDWLEVGPWRDFFREVLLDGQCLFDKAAVSQLLRGQNRGHNSERLFGLVLFELFRREYRIS